MPHSIPNEALTSGHLPAPDAPRLALEEFALTYDGFAAFGFERCERFNAEGDTSTLARARACLFYEQRALRHSMVHDDEAVALLRRWIAPIAAHLD